MMLAYKAEEARDAFEQSQRPIPWSLTEEGIDEVTALVQQYGMDEDTEATAAIGEHTCLNCSNVSPIVFAQAALCLNETCTQYGKVRGATLDCDDARSTPTGPPSFTRISSMRRACFSRISSAAMPRPSTSSSCRAPSTTPVSSSRPVRPRAHGPS